MCKWLPTRGSRCFTHYIPLGQQSNRDSSGTVRARQNTTIGKTKPEVQKEFDTKNDINVLFRKRKKSHSYFSHSKRCFSYTGNWKQFCHCTLLLAINCKFYRSKQFLCKLVQNRNYGILCCISTIISGATLLEHGINWSLLCPKFKQFFLKAETPKVLNTAGKGKRQRPLKTRDIQFQFIF